MLPVAGLPPAAAFEAQPSAPSPSDRLPRPGAAPPPAQPQVAAASGLTGRPDCGSSVASAHVPLPKPDSFSLFHYLSLIFFPVTAHSHIDGAIE